MLKRAFLEIESSSDQLMKKGESKDIVHHGQSCVFCVQETQA